MPQRPTTPAARAGLVADTALALLAERGMRGLTHRAVDDAAGLPQGSTSNVARTRQALLELAVRRLADREERVLALQDLPAPREGTDALLDALALTVHRALTQNRDLTLARYELALEATRRPELRAHFDTAGARFRAHLTALVTALGSPSPDRHALTLTAWADGLLLSCVAGSYHAEPPTIPGIRADLGEIIGGMLGTRSAPRSAPGSATPS
ncbi:TetR family transcriptional regulator C-terminal domain-containing protein [Streptomyces sp. RK31]|uniref:TetR/AcrR family transcriptional regulator n=1 Tax=Streptomyces sp. RK31 TaxID=2824892 RepID=UPI001B3609A3|nr:TetR/AcrR family transcriptional regulator [Streptomyces sp. RK31]MBQ0972735.1 TetR family transcriptional regulator C-terminal domain-containing protein [Streptomyces sp. RK31]